MESKDHSRAEVIMDTYKLDSNGILNIINFDNYDLQHLVSSFMNANSECLLFKNRIEFLEWIKEQPGLKNGVFYRKNIMSAD